MREEGLKRRYIAAERSKRDLGIGQVKKRAMGGEGRRRVER